jgi:hypothetical protein
MGTEAFTPWTGREVDHSPASSAEVMNAWSYTSTSQYFFMVWCLVKQRDNICLHLAYMEKTFLTCIHRVGVDGRIVLEWILEK